MTFGGQIIIGSFTIWRRGERRAWVIQFCMAEDHRPSTEYSRWYSTIARRFLSTDTILRDPRQVELSGDVSTYILPMLSVPRPAHVPEWQCQECRLLVGTHASRRQQPVTMESDEDDSHNEDCSNSQPHPSLGNPHSSDVPNHAKPTLLETSKLSTELSMEKQVISVGDNFTDGIIDGKKSMGNQHVRKKKIEYYQLIALSVKNNDYFTDEICHRK